ncbi:MAG: NfeD family protein [Bacillota bacterium]|nr:MAG: NfeD family protein [Bacillota bacterium]
MELMIWIWLGLILFTLVLEFLTSDMVAIWFTLAAVPSFILSLLNVNEIIQVVTFVTISLILLLLTRPVVMKYFKTNEIKSNVDAVVGQTGVVIKVITPDTVGRVKLRSNEWSAIAKDEIAVGEHVRVLDVEGVKLIVEKI